LSADPDSGTSFECGLAYALGIPIVAVRTDFRAGGDALPGQRLATINLMLAQARSGKHAEAAAFARELLEKHAGIPRWLVQSACGFGLSAAAAPPDQPALRKEYLEKAFVALRKAVEGGYAHPETLECDPDLDPLRGDPRFPPLLARARVNRGKVP